MCNLSVITILSLTACAFINITEAAPKKWLSKFPRCYRDDPKINKCMVEAARLMKPFLKEGIPEFNLPPISPFHVPEISLRQGGDSVSFNMMLKDLDIFGFDGYDFEKFDFDVKNLKFDSILHLGPIFMKGKYEATGKLLSIPLGGKGNMQFNVSSSSGILKQDGKLVEKRGIRYLELVAPIISIKVGKVTDYHYDGLFDGNEVFAKAAEKVFKDYQKELIEEVKPAVEKIIEEIIYDFQKKSTFRVPFDELYPVRS